MVGEVDLRWGVMRGLIRQVRTEDPPSEEWSSLLGQLETVLTLQRTVVVVVGLLGFLMMEINTVSLDGRSGD